MIAVLCAMSRKDRNPPFSKGFKRRVSITPSVRERWTGNNQLADRIEDIANKHLGQMKRGGLIGEANLMLLENETVSIGVRNSGTQAKTNVSLRVVPETDPSKALETIEQIIATLQKELVD
jgi:hypothetical protein